MEFGKEYIKTFDTEAEYLAFKASSGYNEPNVSYISGDDIVHYNPWVETRVVAKYNVTDTSNPTQIGYNMYISGFSAIEIDGVEQSSVVSAYTFSTTGEHTVKYTLTDPTSIGNYAFSGCTNLTSISIPNGVTSIGYNTFAACSSLTSIDIPNSVTSIGNSAFRNCSGLTSIDIPSGVTSISQNAFYYCSSLTSVTIGSGVTSIGLGAFVGCSGLTSIIIPSGVTSINTSAFNACTSLTSVTVNATTPPTLGSGAFGNNASGRKIYVPSASVEAYKTNWSTYASDIEPIS